MKRTLLLAGMIASGYAFGQEGRVGINTESPKAALQVTAKDADKAKGILIPSQTGDELKTNSTSLTTDQEGMISYISEGVTTLVSGETENVHYRGLHRLDYDYDNGGKKSWIRLEPSGLEKVRSLNEKTNIENTAYALVGANLKNLGQNAIDFSLKKASALGESSMVIGGDIQSTKKFATGKNSMVIGGEWGTASGEGSVAINNANVGGKNATGISGALNVNGEYAFAAGYFGMAQGNYGVGLGYFAQAMGDRSFAAGANVFANGDASVAIGEALYVYNDNETALGMANFHTDGGKKYSGTNEKKAQLFSIGAGKYVSNRVGTAVSSNAMVVLRDGSTGIALYADSDTPTNSKPTEKLDVNGNIRVRGEQNYSTQIEDTACDNPGTITYNGNFYGCTGENKWKKLNN